MEQVLAKQVFAEQVLVEQVLVEQVLEQVVEHMCWHGQVVGAVAELVEGA